jgi:hypothetical protein
LVLVLAPLANRKIETRLQYRARRRGGDQRDAVGTFQHQTDAINAEILQGAPRFLTGFAATAHQFPPKARQ